MPFHEQNERNSLILTSIKEKGLMPKQESSIATTRTHDHYSRLCFNVADLDKVPDTKSILESLSYECSAGLWSIAMEGAEIKTPADKSNPDLLNCSIQNSVVFIFAISPELEKAADPKKEITDDKITTTEFTGECYFSEFRTKSAVDPKNILAILVPMHLEKQVAKHFCDVPLIPVDDCITIMKQYPAMFEETEDLLRSCIEDKDEEEKNMQLIGPNFVSGLHQFIEKFPKQRKFGVHLTRLSTPTMFETNTFSVATIKAREEKSICINYKNFNKAEQDRLSLKKYSLSPLFKTQLDELVTYPHLAILKDHTKRNGYFVICDPMYAGLLLRISKGRRSKDEAKEEPSKDSVASLSCKSQ